MTMPNGEPPERFVRFDVFEADLRSRELSKRGVKIKLADQPFSVLALLLAQRGELVTRDELRSKLWPANSFVDFDVGLNKAINRLRDALGDSAEHPRFIETLPKRGYRFIGRLETPAPASPRAAPQLPSRILDPGQRPIRRRRVWLGAAAAAVVGLLPIAWTLWSNSPEAPGNVEPLIRSSLLPPPGKTFVPYSIALSLDGTHLAFVAEDADGSRSLWIRSMDATTSTQIAGTAGASLPFWSPDGRQVAFFADRQLKVVDVAGQVVRVIADAPRPSGGSWSSGGVIVFAPEVNGLLYRVPAAGGTPAVASTLAEDGGLRGHRWPIFLPDDRRFLYVAFSVDAPSDNAPALRVGSLDTLDSHVVEWEGSRSVAYALDHLLYVRGGTLYAQPFDRAVLRTNGAPVSIAAVELAGAPAFYPSALTVSPNGVLLFQSSADLPSQLVWLDEQGREQAAPAPMKHMGPALSPDGQRLAASCEGPRGGTLSICVSDLERGVAARITEGPDDRNPVWSPDGREIAYSSGAGIYRVRADGSGTPQLVSRRGIPTEWLLDGRLLSFGGQHGGVSLALSSLTTGEVTELEAGAEGQLSPNGAWLAYIAREGVVVQRFPGAEARVTIAGAGAGQPRWSRDGRQLFYVSADKKLMAADFDAASGAAGMPRPLAQTRIIGAGLIGFQYDVAPDGRFVMNVLTNEAAPLTLLSGWVSRLQR